MVNSGKKKKREDARVRTQRMSWNLANGNREGGTINPSVLEQHSLPTQHPFPPLPSYFPANRTLVSNLG